MSDAVLRATLGGLVVGDGCPVAIIGVLNVSPESFYSGSIHTDPDDLVCTADAMVGAGAAILDVPFVLACICGTRAWVDEHQELVQRYVRGHVEGIFRFKRDRDFALHVLGIYSGIDDPAVLARGYDVIAPELAASGVWTAIVIISVIGLYLIALSSVHS